MPEWQIIFDSDDFPEPTPEESPRPGARRSWWIILSIMGVLVALGLVTLQRQRAERQALLRNDLTAFIFEEETVRHFGDPDQAAALTIAWASEKWQQAYRHTFQTDRSQSPPAAIGLNRVDFDGHCAVVETELDNVASIRTYCLNDEQQWRRAPLSPTTWGAKDFIDLPNNVRLQFRARDRAFAEALAPDLTRFFVRLAELTSSPVETEEIIIEPRELLPPLIYHNEQLLVVNSPLLSRFDTKIPSGEIAVRLTLAETLLRRTGPVLDSTHPLPGGARFQSAGQTVLAMHLFLPADSQEQLLKTWRTQLDGQWVSPFFAGTRPEDATGPTGTVELATLLTAEYIYQVAGPESLAALMQQLAATKSWDSLFQGILNRSTVALENEVTLYLQAGEMNGHRVPDNSLDVSLPLAATLLSLEKRPADGSRAYIALANQEEPVLVELPPDAKFRTRAGAPLPAGCLVPGTTLTLDGEWLEVQRRLQATQLTVQHSSPVNIGSAPADTVAYLVRGATPDEQDLAVDRIFPQTLLYLTPTDLFVPQELVALRENGVLQTLMPLSPTLRVVSLPITSGGSPHFLFIVDLPDCERTWFVHYDPMAGVTGQWLGPPPPMRWVWRADEQVLMFASPGRGTIGHNIYETDHTLTLRPISQTKLAVSLLGWNVPLEQLVFTKSWIGTTSIGLLDPNSGGISRLKVYIHPMRARQLSPDGNWLAYLTGVNNLFDPPYRLDLFSMDDLTETTLIRLAENEGLGPASWSLYLDQARLAVLTGPLLADAMLRPTRLLTAQPGQREDYVIVAEATAGEQFATPVFCADGGLLYRSDQNGKFHLKRQKSGSLAQTLLSLDTPFQPLACS